jgi:hypothetical protein
MSIDVVGIVVLVLIFWSAPGDRLTSARCHWLPLWESAPAWQG